ncbi:MAG: hypothetical protein RR161_03755 [Bacilli bacterium]
MIKIIKKIPLLNSPDASFTGGQFNLNKYIMVEPCARQIIEYDACLKKERNVLTKFPYSCITKNNCLYYMACSNDKNNLFITTNNYEEIDSICLKIPREYYDTIKSISLNNCLKKILIATEKKIYSIDFDGNFITSEISYNTTNTLIGIANPIRTINSCGCPCPTPVPPKKDYFTAVGYFCQNKYVAYIKDNSAYLAEISNNGNIISNEFIGDNITINSIMSVNGCLQLLVTKNKNYNYIYITDINCVCNCNEKVYLETKPKKGQFDYLEIINKCKESSNCDFGYDIMESIALVETAISHILNAEGEKIQKIISLTDDPDVILKVNESVNTVIKNVTFLEQVLYGKLELVKKNNYYCDEKEC